MNAPFRHTPPRCPYCSRPILSWPTGATVESCWSCNRPLVRVNRLLGRSGGLEPRSLLDLISTVYGVSVVILVFTFAFTGMDARTFAKLFSVLLFVTGSVLAVDGVLALRTGLDCTWKRLRSGRPARLLGAGKIAAGAVAMLLLAVGLSL